MPAPPTTWAGRVDGGGATLAIATEDGVAVAYVCDGRRVEAWLRGTAVDGRLELTGPGGAGLDGGYGDGVATGTVTARGREWTFELGAVRKPSGLYRATATVRNARVTGGWIVLPDGRQVGVLTEDGVPRPAPELDVTTGRVDGSPVRATAVDAAGNGS
ncbi:MAG: hypothetical protein GXX79_16255 [Actinomycetales bacterium]|nr:hypothetical protein [Actinomycetales bacterium]